MYVTPSSFFTREITKHMLFLISLILCITSACGVGYLYVKSLKATFVVVPVARIFILIAYFFGMLCLSINHLILSLIIFILVVWLLVMHR